MTTGFVWHELYMWHDTQNYAGVLQPGLNLQPGTHFENPESKRRFKNLLEVSGLIKHLEILEPIAATRAEILRVHTESYVSKVEAMNATGGDSGGLSPFGPGSVDIAKLSVGGVLRLVDAVLNGEVTNGYALVRPPGHHAFPDSGCGFCMFCNGAIAAEHLLQHHGLQRVAIVDIDVHHGNGAETAFYKRDDVLTISIHQDKCFPPDTGMVDHIGDQLGHGHNINLPMPPGTGSGGYRAAFDRVILPALKRYHPDFIIVSCGFDGGGQDPLGRMMLSSNDYRALTRDLKAAAEALCTGRIAYIHEGGYNAYTVPYMGSAVLEGLSAQVSQIDDPFAPLIEGMGYHELQEHQNAVISNVEQNLELLSLHKGDREKAKKTKRSWLGSN